MYTHARMHAHTHAHMGAGCTRVPMVHMRSQVWQVGRQSKWRKTTLRTLVRCTQSGIKHVYSLEPIPYSGKVSQKKISRFRSKTSILRDYF